MSDIKPDTSEVIITDYTNLYFFIKSPIRHISDFLPSAVFLCFSVNDQMVLVNLQLRNGPAPYQSIRYSSLCIALDLNISLEN